MAQTLKKKREKKRARIKSLLQEVPQPSAGSAVQQQHVWAAWFSWQQAELAHKCICDNPC